MCIGGIGIECCLQLGHWACIGRLARQSDLRAAVQPLRDAMRPEAALVPVLNQQAAPALSAKYDPYGRAYSAAI